LLRYQSWSNIATGTQLQHKCPNFAVCCSAHDPKSWVPRVQTVTYWTNFVSGCHIYFCAPTKQIRSYNCLRNFR